MLTLFAGTQISLEAILVAGVLLCLSAVCISLILLFKRSSRLKDLEAQLTQTHHDKQLLQEQCDSAKQQYAEQSVTIEQLHHELSEKSVLVTTLKTSLTERNSFHQKQLVSLVEQRQQLTQEFERLAQQALNQNSTQLSQSQEKSLRLLLEPVQTQMQRFSHQVQEFQHSQLSSQASLSTELKHLHQLNQQVTKEAQALSEALKGDKKLTGTWGEMQLERCLQASGLQADIHYLREKSYLDSQQQLKRPDFVIKLPDDKALIIDSKVSLIDFTQALESSTEDTQKQAMTRHIKALKRHIDNLVSKDYSALVGIRSPHFVLMFIATEPAFTEAIKFDHTLYDYGLEKNIVLVSPTTLMPLLKTVSQLWLMDRSHSQAFALADKANDLYQQIYLLGERLQKLGRTLNTTTLQYNDVLTAITGRQGLYSKAEKFGQLAKNNQPLPEPQPLQQDIDTHKLAALKDEEPL